MPAADNLPLLKAIIADPEDDTARLAYADWLEENGQGERAEFVRVQVEFARHPHRADILAANYDARDGIDEDWARGFALQLREEALWNFGAPGRWAIDSELPFDHCIRCIDQETISKSTTTRTPIAVFRRGFVAQITCALADWRAHGPALARAHPVETVRLTDGMHPREYGAGDDRWAVYRDLIGVDLFDLMCPGNRGEGYAESSDHGLLESALSAALLAWAKSQPA